MATEKTTNIYQKLLKIQQHIVGLGKDKSGGQFRYVTGDKVLEHIKPIMNEHGLILKQEVLSIENTRQDYKTNSGEKSEINSKVMLRFTWVDTDTGEKDENLFGANGQNGWDKGVGSALTYGERYFLLKYFHIATDEDDIDNPDRVQAGVEVKAKKAVAEKAMAVATTPKDVPAATTTQLAKIKELINNDLITPAEEETAHQRLVGGLTEVAAEKAIQYYQGLIDSRKVEAA